MSTDLLRGNNRAEDRAGEESASTNVDGANGIASMRTGDHDIADLLC